MQTAKLNHATPEIADLAAQEFVVKFFFREAKGNFSKIPRLALWATIYLSHKAKLRY